MKGLNVTIAVVTLPPDYTCDGEDRSPTLEIHGIDTAVSESLALIMTDTNAPGGGGFVHWLIWNIELVSVLPENIPKTPVVAFPISAVQGTNHFGKTGYSGPCPPAGQVHRYHFRVYGIDTILGLSPGARKEALVKAMTGHVVQYGEVSVNYGR